MGQEIEVHWYIEGTPVEILIWKAVDLLLPKTFNLLVTISREKTDVKYRIENGRITNHCSCFAFSPLSPYRIGQGEPIITYLSKNNQLCEV